ncbi:MAG: 16S rRNA (guanine(966)-N(2))-methyltransferase RsmD [Gemmatimonadota bacterium]
MRIIAGSHGSRRLVTPRDARVRPTADRVREAWMNILADVLPGARVLDLFAGSGALGLEALSRGAATATFVDLNPPSLEAIRTNIEALGVGDRATICRGDAIRFVDRLAAAAFDIAFADPPYTRDWAGQLLERFRRTPFARILSIEHPATVELPGGDTRRYGDTAVTFFAADPAQP